MAQRMLTATDGDRDDAAKRLGWSRSKLDARLLLLHASPAVLDALNNKAIKLGHAELLSTLPTDTQDGTVKAVIEHHVSVADLKHRVAAFAHELASAPFDTQGCQGCAHNTTQQADLFETSVGDGRCTNNACWTGKVNAFLDAEKGRLADDVPVVWFDRERTPDSYVALVATGPEGVGADQADACKGCKSFGTLLLTAPGKAGQTIEGQCFDPACNADKRKAYQASLATALASSSSPAAPAKASTGDGKPAAQSVPSPKPKATNGQPKALDDFIEARWRAIAADTAGKPLARAVGAWLALQGLDAGKRADVAKTVSPRLATAVSVGVRGNEASVLAELAQLPLPALADLHIAIAQAHLAAPTTPVSAVKAALRINGATLAEHFVVDKAFLEKHTKSGLEALLRDAKFAEWLDAQDPGKKGKGFAALMAKKKGDIITTVLMMQESGRFDFTGYVPPSVALPRATPATTA